MSYPGSRIELSQAHGVVMSPIQLGLRHRGSLRHRGFPSTRKSLCPSGNLYGGTIREGRFPERCRGIPRSLQLSYLRTKGSSLAVEIAGTGGKGVMGDRFPLLEKGMLEKGSHESLPHTNPQGNQDHGCQKEGHYQRPCQCETHTGHLPGRKTGPRMGRSAGTLPGQVLRLLQVLPLLG